MKSQPDRSDAQERISATQQRILIVEDEALLSWSLTSTLNRAGYETLVAKSGEEAVEKLNTSRILNPAQMLRDIPNSISRLILVCLLILSSGELVCSSVWYLK